MHNQLPKMHSNLILKHKLERLQYDLQKVLLELKDDRSVKQGDIIVWRSEQTEKKLAQ